MKSWCLPGKSTLFNIPIPTTPTGHIPTNDDRAYAQMELALRDMGAFVRGEYSLFKSLPGAVVEEDRPPKPDDPLAAVRRALAAKERAREKEQRQISMFDTSAFSMEEPVSETPEPQVPEAQEPEPLASEAPAAVEAAPVLAEITDADVDKLLIEDWGVVERKQVIYALYQDGKTGAEIALKLCNHGLSKDNLQSDLNEYFFRFSRRFFGSTLLKRLSLAISCSQAG